VHERRRSRWGAIAFAQVLVVATLAGPAATPVAAQESGDLDPTFGTNGVVLTPLEETGPPSIDYVEDITLLPDGRIVATGWKDLAGSADTVVAMYDENGVLDPSFSDDGLLVIVGIGAYDQGGGIAYQPGLGIVVGGYSDGELIAFRLDLTGEADPTFGSGGLVQFAPLGEYGYAWKTAIDPSGRIVMVGQVGEFGDVMVVRFEDDGDLDPTFDGDGIARANVGFSEFGSNLAFDASGRIIVTAYGIDGFQVLRFTDAGAPDATFGTGGLVTIETGESETALDVAVDSSGRIVAVGRWNDNAGGAMMAVRLEDDGDLDPTFDGDGILLITPAAGGQNIGATVALQPDGRIIVGGASANPVDSSDFAVARLLDDGSLDASFAGDGIAITDLGGQDWSWGLALDDEGRIVIAGSGGPNDDIVLARYLGAPPPDTASGTADPGTGGSATTGGDPSPADPVETTVTVPAGTAGGPISITEADEHTVPPPSGYDLLGQEIQISAPDGTPSNPLQLEFLFDKDVAADAGVDETTIQVVRNGVPVGSCDTSAPISPDPCISLRDRTPDMDIRVRVLTSQASAWSFAARQAFDFTGFFQPVDNQPVVNRARAGTSIPVKFSLGGDQGTDIFAATYPGSAAVACDGGLPLDIVEQTSSAGSSGLSYDEATDTYTYVWRTSKAWTGQCRELILRFADGSYQRASFDFRR
jgi:uncharacterized delta-60 repeat protein